MTETKLVKITTNDLIYNKFDIQTLESNIDHLDFKTLLRTQILTAEFCIKYLLNNEYASCVEDTYYFTYGKILLYQTHITEHQLDEESNKNK